MKEVPLKEKPSDIARELYEQENSLVKEMNAKFEERFRKIAQEYPDVIPNPLDPLVARNTDPERLQNFLERLTAERERIQIEYQDRLNALIEKISQTERMYFNPEEIVESIVLRNDSMEPRFPLYNSLAMRIKEILG